MTSLSAPRAKSAFLHGQWTIEDSARLYGLPDWGKGYIGVNPQGHLVVMPDKNGKKQIDIHELVQGLAARDIYTPVVIRFTDILRHRLHELHDAFKGAIAQEGYKGQYRCVYPIKVNQQRQLVEEIRDIGAPLGFGLEAGSKPELLAVLGMTVDCPDMPIICNGFKDSEYIETVILATKLGRNIIPVVEKFSELELIVKHAKRYNVRPKIGIRAKVASRGVGKWESSAGARSKFGLFVSEVLAALNYLKQNDMGDCLKMLHCHLGSQICDIRNLKNAVNELAHIYTELRRLGAGMEMIDIGGGLAVDYDGSQSAYESSMNYTIAEYAADVVYRIKSACDEAGAPHPTIITESGRAMVAYSSILVFDVLGTSRFDAPPPPDELEAAMNAETEVPQPVLDLFQTNENISDRNLLESYHDAMQARDEVMSLFSLGYLSLPMRAVAERLFWSIGVKILERASKLGDLPEEFEDLPSILSDHYFCNFSLFRSMPDSWAIDQLFPILPIHRLNEEPTRRGVLADITCDSDGKVDRFVDKRDIKKFLELHSVEPGKPYYLAAFLVGAYQEILGDYHNLLGDTHCVHVEIDEAGEVFIDEVVKGDTVANVLGYVQIDHNDLRTNMRKDVERAVRNKAMGPQDATALLKFYENGLDGYTYLEE